MSPAGQRMLLQIKTAEEQVQERAKGLGPPSNLNILQIYICNRRHTFRRINHLLQVAPEFFFAQTIHPSTQGHRGAGAKPNVGYSDKF